MNWDTFSGTTTEKNNFISYSNPLVYEQSVYKFSLIRNAQINTCFSIHEPIFAYMSSFFLQTDRYSRWEVMGN
jgi:hypothetical protein